jgi:HEPN domain-containing protein
MNEREDLVSSWLLKAERNLKTALWLTRSPDALLNTASYHLQQAGEKAVKGFLTFHDILFSRTHDIAVLVAAAARVVPEFNDYLDSAELLTPYVVIFRYPDEMAKPTPEEFSEALTAAQHLCAFVLAKLPADVHP